MLSFSKSPPFSLISIFYKQSNNIPHPNSSSEIYRLHLMCYLQDKLYNSLYISDMGCTACMNKKDQQFYTGEKNIESKTVPLLKLPDLDIKSVDSQKQNLVIDRNQQQYEIKAIFPNQLRVIRQESYESGDQKNKENTQETQSPSTAKADQNTRNLYKDPYKNFSNFPDHLAVSCTGYSVQRKQRERGTNYKWLRMQEVSQKNQLSSIGEVSSIFQLSNYSNRLSPTKVPGMSPTRKINNMPPKALMKGQFTYQHVDNVIFDPKVKFSI